jgi:hypothetical protein
VIGLVAPHAADAAAQLVLAALRRSVTTTQARRIGPASLESAETDFVAAIDLDDALARRIDDWLDRGHRKLLLLGAVPERLRDRFGLDRVGWPEGRESWSRSPPAPTYGSAESPAAVQYMPIAERLGGRAWHRPLERFDFTDEWNNLGYGALRADGSPWALASPLSAPQSAELARLELAGQRFASYAALIDDARSSTLWFNRPVGPIDSFEWRLVEQFVASYRHDDLPCYPVLSEIPWGHDAAITMRLDCDEDVESARPLWNAYRELGLPFSLAVHTTNLADARHHPILRELVAAGGSVLSHTATHAPNWGGSYAAARAEGLESARLLEAVTGIPVRYAVSPFHQTPPYALAGLADVGYRGCIGGIIRNDPEFLLARGGCLSGLPEGFVGHSQQCMLHGDCLRSEGDALAIYKQAFDLAFETRTLFGYLDHPFSERYAYGWPDEDTRIGAHRDFVAYVRGRAASPLFLTEDAAMDFIRAKAELRIVRDESGFRLLPPATLPEFPIAIEYRGELRQVASGGGWR